ncbi:MULTISPECIES: hypothetical protein [unclassified Clostridioides]|uniref:hypothetical protein n=1 Tax=unclassified Clostridioides TaxID=2635829 RepID=UPI001D12C9C1|nr:hypothetical protein [Clostridioides sp. ES-S-0171-01]UDN53404.1 hypothetical protein JJC02_10855 [Clostridioides sp. ES-S-0054-01]
MSITLYTKSSDKENKVSLRWENTSSSPYLYRVFRKKIGDDFGNSVDEVFQPISVCELEKLESDIKVLNIHPNIGEEISFKCYRGITWSIKKSASLKKWMEEPCKEDTRGYGLGKINVTPVSNREFCENPDSLLRDSNGMYVYDVIVIGFSSGEDYTNENKLNKMALDAIFEFMNTNRSVIVSHDLISSIFREDESLNRLREFFNIKVGKWKEDNIFFDEGHGFTSAVWGNEVVINKSDSVTLYPWNIGNNEEKIKISYTHTTSNFAYGDIWFNIIPQKTEGNSNWSVSQENASSYYLTTWNNTAMIQIGHNINDIEDIEECEKKILANTIFRMKQLTENMSIEDKPGDTSIPIKPSITNQYTTEDRKVILEYTSMDTGSIYQYYVEGIDLSTKVVTESNVATTIVTTGIKDYNWCLHPVESDINPIILNNPSIIYNKTQRETIMTQPLQKGYYMFRIYTTDYSGNKSKVETKIFHVDGKAGETSNRVLDEIPNAVKFNNRYRGPQESCKISSMYHQVYYNIRKLSDKIDRLDVMKEEVLIDSSYSYGSFIDIIGNIQEEIDILYDVRGD